MHKIEATDPEAQSADLVAGNIATLKALFPELITEGADGAAINVDVLKQLVGDATVSDAEEKYGLNWHGKRRARQLALTPSTGTLRPCPEDSVDWDTTQNLMIEGDNLEVLKLLQKSYAGKVKLIYIDPPYNTGKDFVYPDNFQDSIKNYLELTGQVEGGAKVSSNTEASGRFHTDWLNMMYPRLKLAHGLLKDSGAIFVSIADHEIHNLRAVLDQIFGEENFIANVIWQKVYAPKSSARHFSEDHDYIVVYAKNSSNWEPTLLPRTDEQNAIFKNPDNDPRGEWRANNMAARNYYSKGTYAVQCPGGRVIAGPPRGSYWRISEEKFRELDADGRIWWGEDGNNVPAPKIFLSEVMDGRIPQTLWTYSEVGHTQEAKKQLLALVEFPNSDVVFETPKSVRLLRRIIHIGTSASSDDIVMDFFAGTGTTMDAMFYENAEDGGKRRCILVQLPEPLAGAEDVGWTKLTDVTRARITAAGQRHKESSAEFNGDVGFRTFRLDQSNIRAWQPSGNLEQDLVDSVEHIIPGRSEQDVLTELLLKLGLDLCVPIEQRQIVGKSVHAIGGGVLMACLDPRIGKDDAESLALGIADWHAALTPAGDTTCVFRDSAFENDEAKTNLAAILEQHGIHHVRSL
ncbi:site-specific DNA-methyltransferase [Pseudoxanthomonas kaohsiungensis]|uniref:site-specific DNA-methyltransferase n=1 Tax=Pseudoxanthomonas kaohsiungensis TaxID=283923 RepID=UPI0035AEC5BF